VAAVPGRDTSATPLSDGPAPRGRPRDPSRDAAILDAAIELLVEEGYDRLTVERVATMAGAGKATVYRRWNSKAELVMDAVARIKPPLDTLDTGSLDGDLEALTTASCSQHSELANRVMASVASVLAREPELLDTFRTRFTEPRIQLITGMLERARERGELAPDIDIPMAAGLLPSLMLQHVLLTGMSGGREYAERIVGGVLLPALGRPR